MEMVMVGTKGNLMCFLSECRNWKAHNTVGIVYVSNQTLKQIKSNISERILKKY